MNTAVLQKNASLSPSWYGVPVHSAKQGNASDPLSRKTESEVFVVWFFVVFFLLNCSESVCFLLFLCK